MSKIHSVFDEVEATSTCAHVSKWTMVSTELGFFPAESRSALFGGMGAKLGNRKRGLTDFSASSIAVGPSKSAPTSPLVRRTLNHPSASTQNATKNHPNNEARLQPKKKWEPFCSTRGDCYPPTLEPQTKLSCREKQRKH